MVVIIEYDASWPVLFEEEAHRLRAVLGLAALRIEHVGSTSIPGLAAKPVMTFRSQLLCWRRPVATWLRWLHLGIVT
jgi:hypothetical protein